MCHPYPRKEGRIRRSDRNNWTWLRPRRCRRCQDLRSHHGMTLTDLVGLREAQNRQCFKCSKALPNPRIIITGVRGKGREAKIDHDHLICPKTCHSCERCRRGLACQSCNTHSLALRTVGLFILPEEDEKLSDWLTFLGPEDRDRLRRALTLFPERPVRRVSRRRRGQREAPGATLFDLDAFRRSG